MAEPSGLGVSTGIGKGEAQVFSPIQSDYYKNKSNLALKEKADQEKSFIGLGSEPVFRPDTQEFKQELDNVRQFYRDNQRKILSGDFDTKLKLNELKSGLTQWAANSNAEGNLYDALKKKSSDSESNYYQKDIDALNEYGNTSYKDRRDKKIGLRNSFDKQLFLKQGVDTLKNLPFFSEGFSVKSVKGSDGVKTDIIVNKSGQSEGSLDDIVRELYSAAELQYSPEQVNSKTTKQEYKDYLLNFIDNKEKTNVIGKGMTVNINPNEKEEVNPFQTNFNEQYENMNVIYGVESAEADPLVGYEEGKVGHYNEIDYAKPVSYKGSIDNTTAIPITTFYSKKAVQGGSGKDIKGSTGQGEKFNLSDARKGIATNSNWTIQKSAIYNTFEKGYKTSVKNGSVDVGGLPIDEKSSKTIQYKNKKTEHRYYATLKDEEDNVILTPYYKVRDSISQKYVSKKAIEAREKFEKKTKEYLIKRGWDQAYFDFTGKTMPGSSKGASSTIGTSSEKGITPFEKAKRLKEEKRNKQNNP